MASEATIAAIRLLMESEGITIADLESEGAVGGETVAGFFDQALAAMTDSTRDRYEPYLRILRDGLDETCWCLCEKCCGYVNSVCPCGDGCDCETRRIPVLEVAADGTVTKGIDRGGGCRARLAGLGTVPLAAVTTGHLIVVQSWVRHRGKKRWITANARRADQGRPQHVRDGRSAEENYVSATRRFFRAAVSDGHIRTSPAADLDKPKRKRPQNRALTESRLDERWDALWTTGSDDPELDMFIVWTQLETGARRAGIPWAHDRPDPSRHPDHQGGREIQRSPPTAGVARACRGAPEIRSAARRT